MWPTLAETLRPHVAIYLRLALAAGFLTSVSDRLGLWGPSGTANVAWGTFQRFAAYTGQLNPWAGTTHSAPSVVRHRCGIALLLGLRTRDVALASGVLLGLFGLGMTVGTGLKSALNNSVFAASAGAFAFATERSYRWSLDALLASRVRE